MKRATLTAALFAGLAAHAADTVAVRGELSWSSSGMARVSECGTKRVLDFGTMASSPYFRFVREYDEVSSKGKIPVLVEVQGVLRQSSDSKKQLLEHPKVLKLTKGVCDKPAA
jgi:hypothetical protein